MFKSLPLPNLVNVSRQQSLREEQDFLAHLYAPIFFGDVKQLR
jgi:hypothetical protein